MRKIKTFHEGIVDVTVGFNPAYHEYVVRQYFNGTENRAVRYFTDDKDDAIGTARHMFKSSLSDDL